MTDWTRETPWRQGDQLSAAAAKALCLSHVVMPDSTFVVIATHDCDLAQLRDTER